MIDLSKPETWGTIVGTAIVIVATAMGLIARRRPTTRSKKDTDEINRVSTVIDIAADFREEITRLERKLKEAEEGCAKRIDEIVEKYDRQLEEMAGKNAELKRRLDAYEKVS